MSQGKIGKGGWRGRQGKKKYFAHRIVKNN
jgi:hypothetical protein